MAHKKAGQALAELEAAKRNFGSDGAKISHALKSLAQSHLTDAESLIHFHETLLFLRAYPPNATILNLVERVLRPFHQRVAELVDAGADLSALDNPEVSGIAGGSVTSNFSYAIVRWLVAKYPAQLSIDWDWFEEEDRFGATMPRFLPLLEDDAMVEAHVPFREWLDAARGRARELTWLIRQFESLPLPDRSRAELYDALKLHVTWRFGAQASRTLMRQSTRRTFFHDKPLIQRREISLSRELSSPLIPIQRVSSREGERILDLAREASAVRYRELHGFTYGDPRRVLKAELGRGTEVFVTGVPPENRLPLRAYHAALVVKNSVPVAYFEVVATAKVAGGTFRMRHAPPERILRRALAETVVAAARDFEGPLGVRVEDKRQAPPRLHDLPSLQKLCSARFGWSAAKTLEVAQELYDGQGKKIITYPRAEVRYLPESLIADVPRIVAGLQVGQSFKAIPVPDPPVIRRGANGTFHDKGLEGASHHAVIPNVNAIDTLREVWPRLSIDEKKLFDVIARAYLAALMPDFRYRQTTATLDVKGFPLDRKSVV